MKIIIASVGRTGSTLIMRILNRLGFKTDIAHGKRSDSNSKVDIIFSTRNLNDTIISHWKTELSVNDKISDIENLKITRSEYLRIRQKIVNREKEIKEYLEDKRVLVLEYEKFYNNYDFIYDKLETFLDTKISQSTRLRISREINIESTIEIQKKLPHFGEWSQEHIHGDHISNDRGRPGSSQKYLDF